MSSSNDYHVNFVHQGHVYDIDLKEGITSAHKVTINGKTYAVLGSSDKIDSACQLLKSISLEAVTSAEDIKGRLAKLAAEPKPDQNEIRTPEDLFDLWLTSFNQKDAKGLERFAQFQAAGPSQIQVEKEIAGDLQIRDQVGGFDVKQRLESKNPNEFVILLQEREGEGEFVRFNMTLESREPLRISNMKYFPVAPPPEKANRMSEADALQALELKLKELEAEGKFSGAVIIAKDGAPIFKKASGMSDVEHQIPNQLDTRFNIGSMNKMFTAVAILQLAEKGKLNVKDPVGKYVEGLDPELAKVTLDQLLTHTGAVGDIFVPEIEQHNNDVLEIKDYVAILKDRKLSGTPGTEWEYSNYGFILLGAVVEKASGKGYYDYVRENIYSPLGMNQSDSYLKTDQIENRASGYFKKEGVLQNNVATLPMRGSSAGGGYSTAEDLLKFANGLPKLLNKESLELISHRKEVAADGSRYGLGFMGGEEAGHWYGHTGRSTGLNTELRIYPESGYVISVVANLGPPAAANVAEFIGARLPQ